MKIVKIKGGLGNQLFQYAFGRMLEEKYHECVKYDLHQYKQKFNEINNLKLSSFQTRMEEASEAEISRYCKIKMSGNPHSRGYRAKIILNKMLCPQKYYFETDRLFRDVNKLNKFDYFDGYWQCERYFLEIRNTLLDEIRILNMSSKTIDTISKMENENAVFVGIRRPYSFESKKMKKTLNDIGTNLEYYEKAIKYIKKRVSDPVFYIFSNDIEWVKENFKVDCNMVFRTKQMQTSDEEELMIMSSCKHAILSNSTFNWWGAWLIQNDEKMVLVPQHWQRNKNDIIPDNWIKYDEVVND